MAFLGSRIRAAIPFSRYLGLPFRSRGASDDPSRMWTSQPPDYHKIILNRVHSFCQITLGLADRQRWPRSADQVALPVCAGLVAARLRYALGLKSREYGCDGCWRKYSSGVLKSIPTLAAKFLLCNQRCPLHNNLPCGRRVLCVTDLSEQE